ncbi:MAG: hypothetical protein J0L66_02190 [Cytophagales bacterium]|nr:hypothetical protein [Cytophagales bacterium]
MTSFKNQVVRLPIVPSVVSYYSIPGEQKLDYPAICCFAALGFFLDDDTYFTNRKAFRPATEYKFGTEGEVISRQKYFNWHYTPRSISFEKAQSEFSELLESIVENETANKRIVLPISGGLDSRTLAASVAHRKDVFSYTYQFENGIKENSYGLAVAKSLGISFESFTIPRGYLWNVIDRLAQLNGCYAEFLNPRQMAVFGQLVDKGDIFLLGHGGDLFFDSMGVPDDMSENEQLQYLINKLVKPAGWLLGESLWMAWGLAGDFKEYLERRILFLFRSIKIDNANARLRAFKTEYYVARWTAVNLELFKKQLPLAVPFFHDEMCRFICTVPEDHLASRKLEIEYLKAKQPALANIAWQKVYPCNLYNYSQFSSLPVKLQRGWIKAKRELARHALGKRSDMSNWELQFCGEENDKKLRGHLFTMNSSFVPREITKQLYGKFQKEKKAYLHAITMLLTLNEFGRLVLSETNN